MYPYWFIGATIIFFAILMRVGYSAGTNKTFRKFLTILVPLILAGTAVRIGNMLLPKSSANISFYIAGIGTLLFYIVLSPIFNKIESDRYRRISKESRWFACFIAFFQSWLLISVILFFIENHLPSNYQTINNLTKFFTLPTRIIWFSQR